MPTREAIVDSIIPQQAEKPIPVRTVITRSKPRENISQPSTGVEVPAAAPALPEETVRLSPQLSALARKEQAFRQREQAFKEKERALEAKLAEAEQYSQLKAKLSAKDFSAAEALGLTYEEFTKYKLNQSETEDPNQKAIKELEAKIQALEKGKEESATQEYEETVAAYRKEVTTLVDSDPRFSKAKRFEGIDETGKAFTGKDVIVQAIIDAWDKDSEELTVEQAALQTEAYFKALAEKLADEPPKVSDGAGPGPLPPPRLGTKTLTQTMQPAGVTKQPQKSLQHMSESERYIEARRRVMERRQNQGG